MNYNRFLDFLVRFEGIRLKAYKCPAGVWTIGIGSTRNLDRTPVRQGQICTKEEAYKMANIEAKHMLSKILPLVKVPLNENQLIVLLSFTYNVGVGAFSESTLLKKLNGNRPLIEIEAEFKRWTKAGGDTLPGLVLRRKAEFNLFAKK